MRNLAAAQAEMRNRNAKRKPGARAPRAPKLERGIYVRPVRRDKRVRDFQELRELACQHLRSPRTKTSDWSELFELAVRHGLITSGTPGIHAPENEKSEHQTDMHALVLEVEAEMRKERQKKAKEALKQQ